MDWLQKDVIIDDIAFDKAVNDFSNLSDDLKNLYSSIDEMLQSLKEGFNTPAGKKFVSAYEKILLKPLEDQRLVIDHVSDNLRLAKESYNSVFTEYTELNRFINSVSY